MPPPPLPIGGVQLVTAFPSKMGAVKGKGKEAAERKGEVQDGNEDGDDKDPSYKDGHDLSALHIVQQASYNRRPRSIKLTQDIRHGPKPHESIVPLSS